MEIKPTVVWASYVTVDNTPPNDIFTEDYKSLTSFMTVPATGISLNVPVFDKSTYKVVYKVQPLTGLK